MDTTVQYVDTFELTRSGLEVKGQTFLSHFERLIDDLPDQLDTPVVWSLKGEHSASGQFFLHVRAQGAVMLECQRCLAPFEWQFDTQNRLQVVNTEAALDDQAAADTPQADDPIERIVGSRRLDGLALVEDEIILTMPYVPKHDVCPGSSGDSPGSPGTEPDDTGGVAGRPSPFAVLGKLKKH